MSTRKKLILSTLSFVVLTTLAVWQAMPPPIERAARLIPAAEVSRLPPHRTTCGVQDPQAPVVPGRSDAQVEDWDVNYNTKCSLLILRVTNARLPDQETWEMLLHYQRPPARREFWLVPGSGKKPRCLATAEVTATPESDAVWRIHSWSPDGQWVYLLNWTMTGTQAAYALQL